MQMSKKRKVKIEDEPKNRRTESHYNADDLGVLTPANMRAVKSIPTGDPRHITAVRLGKVDPMVFCKERLRKLPVDSDTGGEGVTNAEAQRIINKAKTEDQEQEATEVRVRGSGEKGRGAKARGQKSGAQRKGVQASTNASKAKARKRQTKEVTK
jgi:hypothetical protein